MIVHETLEAIANEAAASGVLDEGALVPFRLRWPELRFVLCSDEDMPARMQPALSRAGFNLYLIGGGEHCLSLTEDSLNAIGVVFAQVDQE